jgi:hypothetical protein
VRGRLEEARAAAPAERALERGHARGDDQRGELEEEEDDREDVRGRLEEGLLLERLREEEEEGGAVGSGAQLRGAGEVARRARRDAPSRRRVPSAL